MNVLEKSNRLDYGLSLAPDDGWTTSWAIGTTYSLDLNVLLNIPLALFHGKYLSENSDVSNLRSDMLDALNKVKDRITVTLSCGWLDMKKTRTRKNTNIA